MNMFLLPTRKELQKNGIMSYSDQILWQGINKNRWAWFVVVATSIYYLSVISVMLLAMLVFTSTHS